MVPDANSNRAVILAAAYDKTSSFGKGADKAPVIIKEILDSQIELYERYTKTSPGVTEYDEVDVAKLSPEKMILDVKRACSNLMSKGKFVIVLGGEHSVTNGPLQAIAERENPRDITIVQIDAHMDLREDDSDYAQKPHGKFAHSTVMRRASETGFNIVQVGVRAYCEDELNYAMKNKITFFEWGNGDGIFKEPNIQQIIDSIKTRKVYITIDADGFDPAVMPETGTPVPGGLSWDYGVKLINKIFKEKQVIGADMVEIAPLSDKSPTAYNAAQLVYNMVAHHAKYGGKD
jgi:agmatinase